MHLVVDASAVLQALLGTGSIDRLRPHVLHAPALMPSEVTSALRELVWRGEMPADAAAKALDALGTLPIRHEPAGSMAAAATDVATQLGWAKTYDAEYVALAVRRRCPLLTINSRLRRGVAGLIETVTPAEI